MKAVRFLYLSLKTKRSHYLLSSQIGLTNRCNEDCIHCMADRDEKGELSTEQIQDILCQLKELGCMKVCFTGGEPLLRYDFFEIAAFAKKQGLGIDILSNGTLINEKNAELLKEIKPILVQISIYGKDANTHNLITQVEGSFAKSIHAIRLLKKYNIAVSIATTVMRHNCWQLPLIQDMARKERCKILFDFIIRPAYSALKNPLRHRISDAQVKKAHDLRLIPLGPTNEGKRFNRFIKENIYLRNIGRNSLFISARGEVFPSYNLRIKVGDLRTSSLYNIWHSSEKLNWLNNLNAADFECFRCRYSSRCCWEPGLAFSEHKDIFKKPLEICRVMKVVTGNRA